MRDFRKVDTIRRTNPRVMKICFANKSREIIQYAVVKRYKTADISGEKHKTLTQLTFLWVNL